MFDQIVGLANLESSKLGHNYIGTEHLLCALVQMSDPSIESLFRKCLIDIAAVRGAVERIARPGPHHSPDALRLQTPRLKQVISLAENERVRLKHLTPPQSLLLAIIVEGSGVAVRTLRSLRIDLERVTEELQKPTQDH